MPAEALHVVHADDALLVLDKPAGLLSVPGRGADKADCLALARAGDGHVPPADACAVGGVVQRSSVHVLRAVSSKIKRGAFGQCRIWYPQCL